MPFPPLSVRFLYCGHMRTPKNWTAKNHRHPGHYEMLLVKQGTMEDVIGGKRFTAVQNNVLIYPINQWHTEKAVGSVPLEILYWGWSMESTGQEIPPASMTFDMNGRLHALGFWLRELHQKGAKTDQPLKDMLVYAAFKEFQALMAPSEPLFVQAAKRFVENNLSGNIGPDDMAAAAGLSLGHFAHAFKEAVGLPPGEYLRKRRMEQVKTLLLSTPLPLKTIAGQVGYADEYVLFKTFKRVMGVTPGSLRRKLPARAAGMDKQ